MRIGWSKRLSRYLLPQVLFLFSLFLMLVLLKPQIGDAFDPSVHVIMTNQALNWVGLRPDIQADIVDEHVYVDTVLVTSPAHFDNCEFRETAKFINERYEEVLKALNPTKPDIWDATDKFGQLLHSVQDFYAHSNWVELQGAGLVKGLAVGGQGAWPIFQPWRVYSDTEGKKFVIVQGEEKTIPQGWSIKADADNNKVILVTTDKGERIPGVISGTFGLADDCPDSVALSHGNLNKDNEERPGFAQAYHLALHQTLIEWERLNRLVRDRYGNPGVYVLYRWFPIGIIVPSLEFPEPLDKVVEKQPILFVSPKSLGTSVCGLKETDSDLIHIDTVRVHYHATKYKQQIYVLYIYVWPYSYSPGLGALGAHCWDYEPVIVVFDEKWNPIKAIYDAGHYDTEEVAAENNEINLQIKRGTHGFDTEIEEGSKRITIGRESFKKLDAETLRGWDEQVVLLPALGPHILGLWDAFLFPWTVGEGGGRIDSFTSEVTATIIQSLQGEQLKPLATPAEQLLRWIGVYAFAYDTLLKIFKNGWLSTKHQETKDAENAIRLFGLGIDPQRGMVTAEALTLAVPEDYDKVRNAFYAISREGVIFIRPDHQEDGVFVFKGLVVEQGAQLTHYAIINDALTNSKPGEEIFIGPGIYQENLVIAKEVTLKGSGGFRSGLIWVPSVSLVPSRS
jgi:hypothetical protein